MKERAEACAAALSVRVQANRTAALAKRKAKKDREQEAAAATTPATSSDSAKRQRSLAFDSSQQCTQEEPPQTQPEESAASKAAKLHHDAQGEQTVKKKRKHAAELLSEINKECKRAKAARTEEYRAQLDKRTAAPPTKAATTISSSKPAAEISGTGYSRIHPSHKRCRLNGEVIFCWNCGYFMINKSQNLHKPCDPDPAKMTSHQRSMRDNKLRKGLYPQARDGKLKEWKDGTCTSKPVSIEWLDPS